MWLLFELPPLPNPTQSLHVAIVYAAASHALATVEYTAPVTPVRASCQSAVKEPGTPGVAWSAVPVSQERMELAH